MHGTRSRQYLIENDDDDHDTNDDNDDNDDNDNDNDDKDDYCCNSVNFKGQDIKILNGDRSR